METKFLVSIYTPFGKYLVTESDYLSVTTANGPIGVYPNHAPLISTLEISKLTIKNGNSELKYAIGGGVINIKKDHSITLLVDSIERSDEIDIVRAKNSQKRALERINDSSNSEVDIARAKLSLLRALNRLNVSDNN